MIDVLKYRGLLEESWRRRLTETEQAQVRDFLKAHPELRDEWGTELALSQILEKMAEPLVASNFTSLVLQQVQSEQRVATRQRTSRFALFGHFWPRVAFGAVLVTSGLVGFHEARSIRREQMTRSLELVSQVPRVPGPDILLNYDAVLALSRNPAPDEQLLTVLK